MPLLDLTRLDEIGGAESEMLERFLSAIQVERQDFNGRVLTVRRDDLKMLSRLIGTAFFDVQRLNGSGGRLKKLGIQ